MFDWFLSLFGYVWCDRCRRPVEGFLPDEGGMSAGVYVGWTEYMNPGELVVCDQCMWADSRYRAIYGIHK